MFASRVDGNLACNAPPTAIQRLLEDAELVTTEKVGRSRRCSVGPRRLEDVHAWTQMYRRMLDE